MDGEAGTSNNGKFDNLVTTPADSYKGHSHAQQQQQVGGVGGYHHSSSSSSNTTTTTRRRRTIRFVTAPLTLGPVIQRIFRPWMEAEADESFRHSQPNNNSNGNNSSNSNCGNGHSPPSTHLVSVGLLGVFQQCNPGFLWDPRLNPRRVLTKPSRPVHNGGWDNERHDYILYVNDCLGNEEGRKYVILDLLGQGTFGQVVKCQNLQSRELVAVKVIKNQPAYFNQSMMEVTVLEMLNKRYDPGDRHGIVRMRDTFVFRQHLCIVVELLSLNLYDLIKQNQYRGFSLALCRLFLAQTLDALTVLKEARLIHCDLKPENVLLRSLESPAIKVIDFGSACHEHQTLYTYIQSRFYRSPEVLLGLPYSSAIDMWSLGCIAAELFLGLPIFPGASNYDQISRIVESLGLPPAHMLDHGKDAHLYFDRIPMGGGSVGGGEPSLPQSPPYSPPSSVSTSASAGSSGVVGSRQSHPTTHQPKRTWWYALKTRERYSMETGKVEPPPKKYFSTADIPKIILAYPIRPRDLGQREREAEMAQRACFADFVRGLLCLNPLERWSPYQALQHPFIRGGPYGGGPFVPRPIGSGSGSGVGGEVAIPPSHGMVVPPHPMPAPAGRQGRPRANTLGSLSLMDVPGPLQKVSTTAAAANPDGAAVGAGSHRPQPSEDQLISSLGRSDSNGGGVSSVAAGVANIDATLLSQPYKQSSKRQSQTGSLSSQQSQQQPHPPQQQQQQQPSRQPSITTTERMTVYTTNRRASTLVVGGGGQASASSYTPSAVIGKDYQPANTRIVESGGGSLDEDYHLPSFQPSSVPNYAFYHPNSSSTSAPSTSTAYKGQPPPPPQAAMRRSSLRNSNQISGGSMETTHEEDDEVEEAFEGSGVGRKCSISSASSSKSLKSLATAAAQASKTQRRRPSVPTGGQVYHDFEEEEEDDDEDDDEFDDDDDNCGSDEDQVTSMMDIA